MSPRKRAHSNIWILFFITFAKRKAAKIKITSFKTNGKLAVKKADKRFTSETTESQTVPKIWQRARPMKEKSIFKGILLNLVAREQNNAKAIKPIINPPLKPKSA